MSGRSEERQPFSGPREFRLRGTLEMVHEIIDRTVLPGWSYKNWGFEMLEVGLGTSSTFLSFEVFGIHANGGYRKAPIGVITLQSLSNERTLFGVPPRDQWAGMVTVSGHGQSLRIRDSELLTTLAYAQPQDRALYDELFEALIKHLKDEFKRLGILVPWWRRILGWINAQRLWTVIASVIIALVAKRSLVSEIVTKILKFLGLGS